MHTTVLVMYQESPAVWEGRFTFWDWERLIPDRFGFGLTSCTAVSHSSPDVCCCSVAMSTIQTLSTSLHYSFAT